MSTVKVAIMIDREMLGRVDRLVAQSVFPSRSRALQEALAEKLARMEGSRLASECAKLDPEFEKAMAEGGMLDRRQRALTVRTGERAPRARARPSHGRSYPAW